MSYEPADNDHIGKIGNIALAKLERELDIPEGYMMALRHAPTDYDFIVKLSTVIEAILTRAIFQYTEGKKSRTQRSKMSQGQRLENAEALGIIDKSERRLLYTITTIRNSFAHDVQYLFASLSDHLRGLPPDEYDKVAKAVLGAGIPARLGTANDPTAVERLPENFRETLMLALYKLLLNLGYSYENEKRERDHNEWRAKQEKLLGRALPPRTEMYFVDRMYVMQLVADEVEKRPKS